MARSAVSVPATGTDGASGRGRVGPEHADLLAVRAQRRDRVGDRPARRRGPRRRRGRRSARAADRARAATRSSSRFTPRKANSDRQRTSQPGERVARAREDQRRLPGARRRRPAGGAPGAGQPHEARRVVGVVVDALAQDDAAVERRRRRAARARPTGASAATASRTASAVDVAARTSRAGQLARAGSARTARAPGGGRRRPSTSPSSSWPRAIRQWRIGRTTRRRSRRRASSATSASSVALTAPSSAFSIGTSARSTVAVAHAPATRRGSSGSGTSSAPGRVAPPAAQRLAR